MLKVRTNIPQAQFGESVRGNLVNAFGALTVKQIYNKPADKQKEIM